MNQHSVIAYILRQFGYASGVISNVFTLLGKDGPIVSADMAAVESAISTDAAAFAAGLPVISPSVGASINGHAYKITAHFDPA